MQTTDPNFCAIILGSRMQTSDPHAIFWDRATKPQPSAATNPRSIAHVKQPFAAQTSDPHAIFWDRATKPRPSAAKKPRSIAHAKQLGHPLQRTHVDADGRAAFRARSIVGLLPRMAEVWLRDPRRLRADPRFAQQNPRIRGLRS